jgi:hypothetical protein
VREHLVRDLEVLVRVEAQQVLDQPDLVRAERRAVRLTGVDLVGRRKPMWLRSAIIVGRSRSSRPVSSAVRIAARSSASSTRRVCQP